MTVEERWVIVQELMTFAWRGLMELPYEERERRLAHARREHDLSNEALLKGLRGH